MAKSKSSSCCRATEHNGKDPANSIGLKCIASNVKIIFFLQITPPKKVVSYMVTLLTLIKLANVHLRFWENCGQKADPALGGQLSIIF